MRRILCLVSLTVFFVAIMACLPVHASEADALAISQNIQALHMPYGTILDPRFVSSDPASPNYNVVAGYTRCRDSAIWTGHYLAAEAFRYQVTASPDALADLQQALAGISALREVTGTDVLARCLFPVDSAYTSALIAENTNEGLPIYQGKIRSRTYDWVGDTSRDQYSGAFFGLGIAYDMVSDNQVRSQVRREVTRLLNNLIANNWAVVMPDGSTSTVFEGHPEQILSFLQVGRHVNPDQFDLVYQTYRASLAATVPDPIAYDCGDDHNHYFKFNLDTINLYNLIRLEESNSAFLIHYRNAYTVLWNTTQAHQNAHFDLVNRALQGPDAARDQETVQLLEQWLQRPRRDYWVDLTPKYSACGQLDRSCTIVPVSERPNTDFLWQRSPRLLYGAADGTIETAGIDYLLSYWMASYYGLPVR